MGEKRLHRTRLIISSIRAHLGGVLCRESDETPSDGVRRVTIDARRANPSAVTMVDPVVPMLPGMTFQDPRVRARDRPRVLSAARMPARIPDPANSVGLVLDANSSSTRSSRSAHPSRARRGDIASRVSHSPN
eukprot:10816-Pelagococcus_subviridis.AAC.3